MKWITLHIDWLLSPTHNPRRFAGEPQGFEDWFPKHIATFREMIFRVSVYDGIS